MLVANLNETHCFVMVTLQIETASGEAEVSALVSYIRASNLWTFAEFVSSVDLSSLEVEMARQALIDHCLAYGGHSVTL